MQHIITDEEVAQFENTYTSHIGTITSCYKAALTDFLNNRPESTLGKLRPITEMPETVPEGCSRHFAYFKDGQWSNITPYRGVSCDTHFMDLPLPTLDPEAEERQRFEEAMKPHFTDFDRLQSGAYRYDVMEIAWISWKARAELAKAK